MARIVHPRTLNRFAYAISVTLALRIALQDVVAHAFDAAPGEALEIVIAHVQLSLVSVQARPWVHTAVRRTAEGRLNTIVVCLAEDLLSR